MNGKDLLEGIGCIDERFVDEAEKCGLPRRIYSPWLRIAACLCVVMLSFWCIQPLLNDPHGQVPPTTAPDDPFFPEEGFTEVILYVEEMTDDGFTGTVAELVTPDIFEVGMELDVVIAEDAWYEKADGSSGHIGDQKTDFSGSQVLVVCTEYDPDTAAIVVDNIWEVQPPETTP